MLPIFYSFTWPSPRSNDKYRAPLLSHSSVSLSRSSHGKQDATPLISYMSPREHWLALRGARGGTITVRSVQTMVTERLPTVTKHVMEFNGATVASSLALGNIQDTFTGKHSKDIQGFRFDGCLVALSQNQDKNRLWIGCDLFFPLQSVFSARYCITYLLTIFVLKTKLTHMSILPLLSRHPRITH